MLIRQVALVAKTKKVAPGELMRVGAALQRQATRDLSPIWDVQATVDTFTSEADVPLGYWKIRIMDKLPEKGAGGFHFDDNGQPEADVLWTRNWSLASSHECLEMLVDPFGKLTQSGPSPKSGQDRVELPGGGMRPVRGSGIRLYHQYRDAERDRGIGFLHARILLAGEEPGSALQLPRKHPCAAPGAAGRLSVLVESR